MKSTFMMEQQDYFRDIADIRSMMERTTKFLSLSGWAGVMAGIYALAGAYIAYSVLEFNPDAVNYAYVSQEGLSGGFVKLIVLGFLILVLAIATAIYFSKQKADQRNEKIWNATSRRLISNMAVPLFTGGLLILIFISKGLLGLIAPMTLLFYGISIYLAGRFTYAEVKAMGLIQIILGLLAACFIEYSILLWALGFGVLHIIYGGYLHFKYEK